MFLLVPAHPGSPGKRVIKRSLLMFVPWDSVLTDVCLSCLQATQKLCASFKKLG